MAPPSQIDVAFDNLPLGTPTVCMEQVMENIPGSPDFANCTANDLNLFFTLPGQGQDLPLCLPGQALPNLEVEAHFGSGAQNRWDVGLWIRSDGSGVPDALRGQCRHWSLTPVGTQGDLTAPNGVRLAPFYNQDGDTCGDLNQAFETVLTNVVLSNLTCTDSDGDGFLDIGACVGYDNNGNQAHSCTDPATAVLETSPNTPSKCSCGPLDIPVRIAGKIIIRKVTVPSPDPSQQDFVFTSATDGLSGTIKNGGSYEKLLVAGTYSVAETVPAGWDLTNIQCTDPSGGTTVNLGTATASIALASGETVDCTFTNRQRGSITIIKDAVPNDAQDFSYTSTTSTSTSIGSFLLDDDADGTLPATRTFSNLIPGTYSVTEASQTGWDLTGLSCSAGGSGNLGTRTASITLPAGGSVTCTFVNTKRGSITIVKDAIPDDAQDFAFTATSNQTTTIPNFSLDDDADGTLPNSRTFDNLLPGNYSVTEGAVANWQLTNLQCTAGGTPNLGTKTAAIVLAPGASVTCTYTNTKGGTITIVKDAVPNDAQDFAYTSTGTGIGSFSLDDDADGTLPNSRTFNLEPGNYTVTETLPVTGWDLTDLQCTAGGTPNLGTGTASIVLPPGGSVTCTFTNTKRGSITIVKDAIPNDAQDFAYTSTSNQTTTIGSFDLDDDADGTLPNSRTFPNLKPGNYSVTETAVVGWDLTNLQCTAGGTPAGATANIVLPAGGSVTCTYTNTKRGSITIVKDAIPNDAQDFAYTSTSDQTTSIGPFSLDDDVDPTLPNSRTFTLLKPGNYSVTETLPVTGWDHTNLQCTAGGTPSGATANIVLPAGGSVTCTYTNTKRGTIIITKDAQPDDAEDFSFTSTSNQTTTISPFLLDDDADGTLPNSRTFDNLKPGSYTVTEGAETEWDLTALSCTDPSGGTSLSLGTRTVSIGLAAGETVSCTFTNRRKAKLIVEKQIVGGGTQLFDFSRNPGNVNFTLTHGGSNDSGFSLTPATYRVCELNLAVSWAATATLDGNAATLINPDFPQDLGNRCVDVPLTYGDIRTVVWTNRPPPGGNARTIGYWKNWSSCSGGQQYQKATERGILDKTLDGNLPQTVGILVVDTCEKGVAILDHTDLNGRKRASDAAYNLAAQLLAAKLNFSAGAGTCQAATDAATAGQALLVAINFDGVGQFLRPQNAQYSTANNLAGILDSYNNNTLCPT